MPGIFGSYDGPGPELLEETVYAGPRHRSVTASTGPALGMVHHGSVDPAGWRRIEGDGVVGLVYGSVTNHDLRPSSVRDLVRRPLDGLPRLDGPFAFAGYDRDRDELLVATDKLGTRSLYFTPEPPIVFGSELSTALAGVSSRDIDARAVADLLLMDKVWGEKTLVEQVERLRPGSYLKIGNDGIDRKRYWSFDFRDPPRGDYVETIGRGYRDALEEVLGTIPDRPGIWLSGGLDSRILAGAMHAIGRSFHAVSYRRPTEHAGDPLWDDVAVARQVAGKLGEDHQVLSHDPASIARRMDRLVRLTDGQVGWPTLTNLGAVFDLDVGGPAVMLEGPVPLLTGEKVDYHHLEDDRPAAETLADLHAFRDPGEVATLLADDRDPIETFRREVDASGFTRADRQVIAATNDNYYSRGHFISNKVARSRVGTRETLVDGSLLESVARMPRTMRRRRLPGTSIPHVPSPLKLRLARKFGRGVRTIPYSMTKLPPIVPYHIHGLSFPVVAAFRRATSERPLAEWVRSHPDLREKVWSLLEEAMERDVFDGDAIREIWQNHLTGGEDRLGILGAITTVELFHQQYLDAPAPVPETPARAGI